MGIGLARLSSLTRTLPTILHVRGNVDGHASTDFFRFLAQASIVGSARVVLDFEYWQRIDVSVMSAISRCRDLLGESLRVVVPRRNTLRSLFRDEQPDEYDRLSADLDTACESLLEESPAV